MEEVKAILVLAALVLIPLGICLAVVRVALYVADRIALRFSWTKKLARIIGTAVSLIVLLLVLIGLIVAFGAVANAETNTKATMLARGISEVLACTPLVVAAVGTAAGVISLVVVTRRWTRRPPASDRST
jgi:hypothetical protein